MLGLFDPTILGQCQQLLVSEAFNKRVQVLEARPDTDNDSMLDEIDLDPTSVSSEARNGDTGLTVVSLGGPSTNVYAPAPGPGSPGARSPPRSPVLARHPACAHRPFSP